MVTLVRRYRKTDVEVLAQLFFDSVRYGTTAFYTAEQREAWASAVPDTQSWAARLEAAITFVAERSGEIVGFMTLDESGYIDLAFVRADSTGQGVGAALYQSVQAHAVSLGFTRLHTQASEMAKPFFEKQGWEIYQSQTINRGRVELVNHRMQKQLIC